MLQRCHRFKQWHLYNRDRSVLLLKFTSAYKNGFSKSVPSEISIRVHSGVDNEFIDRVRQMIFLKPDHVKINKIVNNPNKGIYNNVIEAFNHRFKSILLKQREFDSLQVLQNALPDIVEFNNNLFFPLLHHLSPNEVLNGKLPDKSIFKKQMADARNQRAVDNVNNPCGICV